MLVTCRFTARVIRSMHFRTLDHLFYWTMAGIVRVARLCLRTRPTPSLPIPDMAHCINSNSVARIKVLLQRGLRYGEGSASQKDPPQPRHMKRQVAEHNDSTMQHHRARGRTGRRIVELSTWPSSPPIRNQDSQGAPFLGALTPVAASGAGCTARLVASASRSGWIGSAVM